MICNLCPRQCHVERSQGHCRMPQDPMVARIALHQWEEPPISGTKGSGTIFFSGCSLDCVFCQNDEISHRDVGKILTQEELRTRCQALVDQGAHNLNFVNPTHYAHVVAGLLETAFDVPTVWNTGGYDRVETLRSLEGKIDIYLPDLKYLNCVTAQRYSGAEDYPDTAKSAILEMVRQTGPYVLEDGLLKRGVIIRHLILPGQVAQAKAVMDWVAETFPRGAVLFSLMGQYTPLGRAGDYPELNRTLRGSELRTATAYMENLGLEGFCQGAEAANADYVPNFDLTGL